MRNTVVPAGTFKQVALAAGQFELVLARLPQCLQEVSRRFHQATGMSVVAAIRSGLGEASAPTVVVPPMHPVCAKFAGGDADALPCAHEWAEHVRVGLEKRRRQHLCKFGLLCACVPVLFGGRLVGLCKLVAGRDASDQEFQLGVEVLEALVEGACHHLHAMVMADELAVLREHVSELRSVKLRPAGALAPTGAESEREPAGQAEDTENRPLAGRALHYLNQHYMDAELSVLHVARTLEVNDKYLSNVFARHVGTRMRAYIIELRVRRACELLLTTAWQIKRIAHESGFHDSAHFGRCFRRQVGVAAGEYRRVFSAAG